jgi:glutamine amidotransferase
VREVGKPFIGLCLGMQLLATSGTEHGVRPGLGWIGGTVDRLPENGVRIPHVGWNDVKLVRRDGLYADLPETGVFYFVHSYVLQPEDPSIVTGVCDYGAEFCASVETGNIFATQYHPEKSQKAGLSVLGRFLTWKG